MLTKNFLELQRFYFRMIGFEIFVTRHSWQHPYRGLWIMLALASFLPLTVIFGLKNIQNVDMLTDALCSVLVDVLALSKFGLILLKHGSLVQLIAKFRRILTEECSQGAVNAVIIAKENLREQRISGLYKNCFLLACLMANLMPLGKMLRSYLLKGFAEPELPFPSVYPWDINYIHNYLISYVWNVSAALAVVFASVCVDTLFCSLTHNLCALYKIAQYRIEHFKGQNAAETKARLSQVFSLYQKSLDMTAELNRCFRELICMQFLVASLHLCVLSYQVSVNLTHPEVLFYMLFIASILVQVFIFCHCGECVRTESTNFNRAIYNSCWYEGAPPGVGRSLIISMIRSQRGCYIDGYFFEATMATFLLIVNRAMSYITLLRSFS